MYRWIKFVSTRLKCERFHQLFLLLFLTCSRYFSIIHSHAYQKVFSNNRMIAFACATWLWSFLLGVPLLTGWSNVRWVTPWCTRWFLWSNFPGKSPPESLSFTSKESVRVKRLKRTDKSSPWRAASPGEHDEIHDFPAHRPPNGCLFSPKRSRPFKNRCTVVIVVAHRL